PVKPADRLCGTGFQPVEPADHLCGTGFQPVKPADRLCGTGFQPVEPKALYDLTGVALVCVRSGPDRVAVYSRRGSATVERRIVGGLRQYRMTVGSDGAEHDPVGYDADSRTASLVSSGWHSSSEWLAATAGSTCPDFVPQVVEMFDSPRAGDLVVFADDQASFGDRFAGGHGSCLGSDMVVPLYFSGPDLPAGGRIPAGRIVDVMPTILDLLGLGDRLDRAGPIDGVSLAEALRTAGQGR
ncbi:MAG: hypothetical protein ACE5GE_12190, partial [Phycisphaerae bacterium]